jgi:hypothetical protein
MSHAVVDRELLQPSATGKKLTRLKDNSQRNCSAAQSEATHSPGDNGDLGYWKVCSHWVPCLLTEEHRMAGNYSQIT